MSLKDLFKEDENLKSPEPLTKQDIDNQIESFDFMAAVRERNHRFLPLEEFANPKAFARFGSAEKYYEDSISRIYDTYPYDGSLKEKALWELSSSYLDLYIFENGYPRTTGYITLTTSSLTATDMYNGYGAAGTSSYEYILIKGGPNPGTGKSLYYDYQQDKTVFRKDANIYDLSKNRENNLKIGGTDGNTVEFWLKKAAFDNSATEKEVILDVFVTGTLSSSADYARLRIEMTGAASGSPFLVTYMSGTTGFAQTSIGSSITAATVADDAWHHYAFRFKNTGSNVVSDLFIDGDHNHRVIGGTAVSYVSGALVATLGALGQSPSGNVYIDGPDRGYAKLSGSLDEFRYWKTFRTSEKIQRYWFGQVGAGTNSDPANTDLGVYYKFNEGITQTASVDSSVLDFSGRISNGAWTGYSTLYSRNTGSAIISSSASPMEFEDPIIYSFQPNVAAFKTQKKLEGRIHDDTNGNGLDSYLPQWMLQANETDFENLDQNQLLNALQIIGSYFDSAAILMDKLPALKHEKYYTSGSFAPPFNKRFLESKGFIVPDIFINAGLLNQFEDRDDHLKYEHTLQEIKNTIYQNIYNNLTYINKSKGTEKAFRNLLRCFGLGDNVLKFNVYANNTAYQLEDNTKQTIKTKSYVNFNEIDNGDASVYQYRTDSNATSYISGTKDYSGGYEGSGLGFTLEGDFILPNRVGIMEYATLKPGLSSSYSNLYPLIVSSSLFGLHTANGTENDLTWDTNDYANFQVYTAKDDKYSSNAKFILTSTAGSGIPLLTSSYFEDIYDDDRWSVSVSIRPKRYPQLNQPSGSRPENYIVQFYGCNYIGDLKHKSFLVTGSMTTQQGRNFLASHKRVYAGAHRTNFTGALLQFADTKATEVKAWYMPLDTAVIDQHNMKVDNYGASSPTQNAFLYQNAINRIEIPEIDTLALRWNFNAVSSSNAVGQFAVEDASSGSAAAAGQGWFSGVVDRRHTASGSFFATSSANAVQKLERGTLQQQVPEVLLDSNLVNIIENQSDDFYTRGSRPITYNLSIEKNLFQDISEDMLNMFASVGYFNTLLGTNVNRYRGQYKELIKAGNQYFEKVDNDYDFDKYVEYFKYIDYAVSRYIQKLVPASLDMLREGLSTVIENFVLGDRNKFRNKPPIIREMIPEFNAQVLGINELTYNWKYGHAPLDDLQKNNCRWWLQRASRKTSVLASGDTQLDIDKQEILESNNNETNAPDYTLKDSVTSAQYSGSTYAIRRLAKPYKVLSTLEKPIKGGSNYYPNKNYNFLLDAVRKGDTDSDGIVASIRGYENAVPYANLPAGLHPFPDCADSLELEKLGAKKRQWEGMIERDNQTGLDFSIWGYEDKVKIRQWTPFSLYSSSVDLGGVDSTLINNFQTGAIVTNLHDDVYGHDKEVPMQGPFTEKFVGGLQYRHIALNSGSNLDTAETRPEGWSITYLHTGPGTTLLYLGAPYGNTLGSRPTALYYRDETAKRPVNIRNIQQTTASNITHIGNYTKDYEVVLTNGRSTNNVYLTEVGAITASSAETLISGVFDYALPDRTRNDWVIVNRFSAPGGPEVNGLGFLDIEANEYSVYNALPWRNLTVRQPLRSLLSDHSKQFGYFSDAFNSASYVRAGKAYPGTSGSVNTGSYYAKGAYQDATASFQKVNRNSLRTLNLSDSTETFVNPKYVDFESGSAQYLSGAASPTIIGNAKAFTFSAWVKPESLDTGTGPVMSIASQGDYTSALNKSFEVNCSATNQSIVNFAVFSNGGADLGGGGGYISYNTPASTLAVDTWTHLAFTFDEATQKFNTYVNGVTGSRTLVIHDTVTIKQSTAPLLLGARDEGGTLDDYFDGGIDEVSYWNIALNAAGIREIFEGDSGVYGAGYGPGNLNNHTEKEYLVSWWRLGDGCKESDPTFCDDLSAGVTDGVLDVGLNGNKNHLSVPLAPHNPAESSLNYLTGGAYYLITPGAKEYDNFFVQHPIPRTDLQYAWITASLVSDYSGSALYQYEQRNMARADYASTDITFCSASDFVSYDFLGGHWWGQDKNTRAPGGFAPSAQGFTDFVGLNYNIYETASLSQNSIGWGEIRRGDTGGMGLDCASSAWYNYMGQSLCTNGVGAVAANVQFSVASLLNGVILHRQGPYGWPSWKQIRGAQHPIARAQQAHNTIGYIFPGEAIGFGGGQPGKFLKKIRNFTEPIATSKYKPLRIYMPSSDTEDHVAKTVMTYGNQNVMFTDHSADILNTNGVILDTALVYGKVRPKTYSPYLAMKALVEKSNRKLATEVLYTEVIYPKEQFTYLSESRRRLRFANDYWRNSRSDRLKANLVNFADVAIKSSSLWNMDAHPEFTTTINYIPFSATMPVRDGTGELQNCYNLFHYSPLSSPSSHITAAPSYVRRIPLITAYALTASNLTYGLLPGYTNAVAFSGASEEIRLKTVGGAATTYSPFDVGNYGLRKMPLPVRYSASVGDTLWEVTSSTGKDITPFYDSYNDYAEEGTRIMQEGTILPEFRISEKMASYYSAAADKNWVLTFPTKDNFKTDTATVSAAQYALRIQDGLLELTGASYNHLTETDKFLNRYAFSDFYRHFKLIKKDYNDNRPVTQTVEQLVEKKARSRTPLLSLGCEALMKLVPYDGFYPAQRSVQLASLFSASYYNSKALSSTGAAGPMAGGQQSWRTAMQPFYAPGIFYNTIKSGIAVDYPIHSPSAIEPLRGWPASSDVWGHSISGSFTQRVNFEQIVNGPATLTIKDTDPFLDTRLNSTASIKQAQSPLYKFAANNFFSEVTNFFIDSGRPTGIYPAYTLPETVNIPVSGVYVMDIVLRNSTNIVDMKSYCEATASLLAPSASSLFVNSSSFIMYSRANTGHSIDSHLYGSSFGPPVRSGYVIFEASSGAGAYVYRNIASFEPYTPPYYDGYASCRMSIGLEAQSGLLIEDVLNNLTMSYSSLPTFTPLSSSQTTLWDGTAQTNAMQVSASLNFGQAPKDAGSEGGNWIFTNENNPADRRLVIHSKFECPVLDFSTTAPTEPFSNSRLGSAAGLSGSVARGMWHQMGTPPVSGNGLWMEVQDPSHWLQTERPEGSPHFNNANEYKSLSFILGFTKGVQNPKKIGVMPKSRTLSEAIVAIPFKVVGDLNAAITETELYRMSPSAVDAAKNSVEPFGNAGPDSKYSSATTGPIFKDKVVFQSPSFSEYEYTDLIKDYWREIPPEAPEGVDPAIYKLLSLMRKYVIPPHLDFLHNSDIDPFTMYMWEFETSLDEEDLRNMWQNTAPKIAKRAIKATSDVITHVLPTTPGQAHVPSPLGPNPGTGGWLDLDALKDAQDKKDDLDAYFGPHPYFLDVFDEDKTRWAVFKVKKRGRNNYANIAGRQEINGIQFLREGVEFPHDFAYSYNWPHDFFSLVELAKITSTVTFNPQTLNPAGLMAQILDSDEVKKATMVSKIIGNLADLGSDEGD
jgi:hypothetical protein